MKAWFERNPEKRREYLARSGRKYRQKQYGLTEEDLAALHERFKACAICNKLPVEGERALCIDHCHVTGRVRGLLCSNCNVALGHFSDDVDRLQAAISYLKGIPYYQT